jgi:hypothetical protein
MQVGQPVLRLPPILAGIIDGTAICRLHTIAPIKNNKGMYATSHTRF